MRHAGRAPTRVVAVPRRAGRGGRPVRPRRARRSRDRPRPRPPRWFSTPASPAAADRGAGADRGSAAQGRLQRRSTASELEVRSALPRAPTLRRRLRLADRADDGRLVHPDHPMAQGRTACSASRTADGRIRFETIVQPGSALTTSRRTVPTAYVGRGAAADYAERPRQARSSWPAGVTRSGRRAGAAAARRRRAGSDRGQRRRRRARRARRRLVDPGRDRAPRSRARR